MIKEKTSTRATGEVGCIGARRGRAKQNLDNWLIEAKKLKMCGLPSSHDRDVDHNFKSEHIYDIEKYITIRSSLNNADARWVKTSQRCC